MKPIPVVMGTLLLCLMVLVSQVSSAAVNTAGRIRRESAEVEQPTAEQQAAVPETEVDAESRAGRPVLPMQMGVPGGNSAFGPYGTAFHEAYDVPNKVLNTHVDCQKSYMNVVFQLSRPFFGFIYPYNGFDKCVLHVGKGETEITMSLSQDKCGGPPAPKVPGYSTRINPIIEHRLMIQWDTDLVQEYDTDVLVICDRPADYNRTVRFDLASVVGEKQQFKTSTHPGPQMWMEIQRGEGPRSSPLLGPVHLGETLTMVFTVADDTFKFDSNIIECYATDANIDRQTVPYDQGMPSSFVPARPMLTQIPVIEKSCSIKPKLFGNFLKVHEEFPNQITTTQWAYFKAFRFPTSSRVLIQCDIQVCYDKCFPQQPCDVPFDVRTSARKRREANANMAVNASDISPIQPERLTMSRFIEVILPENLNLKNSPPSAIFGGAYMDMSARMLPSTVDCITTSTFYGIVLGLGIIILVLIGLGAIYIHRQNKKNVAVSQK